MAGTRAGLRAGTCLVVAVGQLCLAVPGAGAQSAPTSSEQFQQRRVAPKGSQAPADVSRFVLDLAPGVGRAVLDLRLTTESVDGSTAETDSEDAVDLTLAADVFFAFDRADLQPAADPVLRDVATRLRTQAQGEVEVVEHADAVGDPAYNLDLSRRRAAAVVAVLRPLLAGTGVSLVPSGRGSQEPVAQERSGTGKDDPQARARNRRVTITFQKP